MLQRLDWVHILMYCGLLMIVMITCDVMCDITNDVISDSRGDDVTSRYDDTSTNQDQENQEQESEENKFIYRRPRLRGDAYFTETFDYRTDEEFKNRWVVSEALKDYGSEKQEVIKYDDLSCREATKTFSRWVVEPAIKHSLMGDKALVLKSKSRHHAISVRFNKTFSFTGPSLVLQYEVKYQYGIDCGGAYVKLLSAYDSSKLVYNLSLLTLLAPIDANFSDKTPYVLMFGPDQCGKQYKIHLIIRHKNPLTGVFEEKHAKKPDALLQDFFNDKMTHLYTLVLQSNNKFEMYVDRKLVNSGSLLTDMTPSVNPEREISDPDDKQPEDWDIREKIVDPNATKPLDWDQPEFIDDKNSIKPLGWLDKEPELIPDRKAKKPADWDDTVDGVWEPPMINNPRCDRAPGCGEWRPPQVRNPAYKGEWSPPVINNPNYKGKWKARMIPNPDYYEDLSPYSMQPVEGLGLELWSVAGDVLFDNFIVTDSLHTAQLWANDTWSIKHLYEKQLHREELPFTERWFRTIDESPVASLVTLVCVVVPTSLFLIVCCQQYPKKQRSSTSSSSEASDSTRRRPHSPAPQAQREATRGGVGSSPQDQGPYRPPYAFNTDQQHRRRVTSNQQ